MNFTNVIHPHLEHTVVGVPGHASQTERQSPVVVEVALAGNGQLLAPENQAQSILGACLADTAGNGDNAGTATPPCGLGHCAQGIKSITDLDQWCIVAKAFGLAMHERSRGAACKGISEPAAACRRG